MVKFILENTRHTLSYHGGTNVSVELQTLYKVGICLKHENDVLYNTHTRYSNSFSHKIQYRKIVDKPVFQGPG